MLALLVAGVRPTLAEFEALAPADQRALVEAGHRLIDELGAAVARHMGSSPVSAPADSIDERADELLGLLEEAIA